mgnify:CR=1 FL=1
MARVYNFSAGPSMLPESVLKTAAEEMLDYHGSGESGMEMSHRSKTYDAIIKECEALLREVMGIPDTYKVLFLQGGASSQFAMLPLNLMNGSGKADFVITGQWANKAYQEASRYGETHVVASSKDKTFSYIPKLDPATFTPDADYFHICMNNTIYGTRFVELPDVKAPLVADASSMILSEPMDVNRYGVIYAGAQKNIGPSGLCVVIVCKDLLGHAKPICPKLMDWKVEADKGSMYNTPNTWGIYLAGLTFDWLLSIGGVEAIYQVNQEKAKLLYDFLDNSKLFKATAQKKYRSLMNVTFVTGDAEKDAAFVKAAAAQGLVNLKGHRTVGGMRASIYNAMPMEGVKKLVGFMKEFERENV